MQNLEHREYIESKRNTCKPRSLLNGKCIKILLCATNCTKFCRSKPNSAHKLSHRTLNVIFSWYLVVFEIFQRYNARTKYALSYKRLHFVCLFISRIYQYLRESQLINSFQYILAFLQFRPLEYGKKIINYFFNLLFSMYFNIHYKTSCFSLVLKYIWHTSIMKLSFNILIW